MTCIRIWRNCWDSHPKTLGSAQFPSIMQSRVALPAVMYQNSFIKLNFVKFLIRISGIPLVFIPPGHGCVSIVFRAVLAQVMFH